MRAFEKISKEKLLSKLMKYSEGSNDLSFDPELKELSISNFKWRTLTKQIEKDLLKVDFDCENVEYEKIYDLKIYDSSITNQNKVYVLSDDPMNELMGLNTLPNGLTFLGLTGGGDWEFPVFFMIYWDGRSLRAYIPTDGNPWNTDLQLAYGNEDHDDIINQKKRGWYDDDDVGYEPEEIIKDINKHFREKNKKIDKAVKKQEQKENIQDISITDIRYNMLFEDNKAKKEETEEIYCDKDYVESPLEVFCDGKPFLLSLKNWKELFLSAAESRRYLIFGINPVKRIKVDSIRIKNNTIHFESEIDPDN